MTDDIKAALELAAYHAGRQDSAGCPANCGCIGCDARHIARALLAMAESSITLSPADADKVAALVEARPAPTPEMTAMFARTAPGSEGGK